MFNVIRKCSKFFDFYSLLLFNRNSDDDGTEIINGVESEALLSSDKESFIGKTIEFKVSLTVEI